MYVYYAPPTAQPPVSTPAKGRRAPWDRVMAAPFSRCLRRAPGQTLVSHRLRDLHQLPGDAEDALLGERLDLHQLL